MPEIQAQEFWWADAASFLLDEELQQSDSEGSSTPAQPALPCPAVRAAALEAEKVSGGEAGGPRAAKTAALHEATAELELPWQSGGEGALQGTRPPPPPPPPSAFVVRPPRPVEAKVLRAVRLSYRTRVWELAGVRDGPKDSVEVLRPPAQICPPDGAVWERGRIGNPIADLGSCACPAERVRPAFLRFCMEHVRRALPRAGGGGEAGRGLVYATLGSGELYHDWEVLERLLDEGYGVESVHAVDLAYTRPAGAGSRVAATSAAVRALAAWLGACGVPLCAYREFSELTAAQTLGFDGADVLMQCDMDCPDIELERALRPGGLHLHLSQGEGKWFQAWQRPAAGAAAAEAERPEPPADAASHARTDGLVLLEQRHGVLGTAPSEQLRYRTLEEMQEDRDDVEAEAGDELREPSDFDAALHAAQSAFVDIFEEETEGGGA